MSEFVHFCPGCQTLLKAEYKIVDGEVIIKTIDSEYNLYNFCANCRFNFSDSLIEKIELEIEKQLKEDNE